MYFYLDFPTGSAVKNLPATHKMQVWPLGREDPLEEETATHSSILAESLQVSIHRVTRVRCN